MLVDGEDFVVGQQGKLEVIIFGQVAAEDERGLGNGPEGHEGVMLVLGEVGPVVGVIPGADVAEGDHVGIRPVTGAAEGGAEVGQSELPVEGGPVVPEVSADAPLVGVGGDDAVGSTAGGNRKHDGAAALVNGFADGFDFGIMAGKVVHLHEIETPGGQELENGIVVFLGAGFGHVHAIHVAIPAADVDLIGNILSMVGGAEDGGVVAVHGLARDAAEEVEAEFKAHGVQGVADGFEGAGVLGEGEAVGRGEEAAIGVGDELGIGAVAVGVGEGLIPLDVNGDEVPAVGQEIFDHVVGVGHDVILPDASAEAVPGVPAHGRRGGPGIKGG